MSSTNNKSIKIYCPVSEHFTHWLLKIIIQAVEALTDLCEQILNTCTVLNCVTMLKFDML